MGGNHMSAQVQKRALVILEAILAGDIDNPLTYLQKMHPGEEDLHRELAHLLSMRSRMGLFLERQLFPDLKELWEEPACMQSAPFPQFDGYQILKSLGEGGMGEVYLARQQHPPQRKVALKCIRKNFQSKANLDRFSKEYQALACMSHPNIAQIFEVGRQNHQVFFTMEYFPGEGLVSFCVQNGLDLKGRLELFLQVCEGVAHMHDQNMIHRDLKPSNVLVAFKGQAPFAKIIDLGIARSFSMTPDRERANTRVGEIIGTPVYMSPEQLEGQKDLGPTSDIYGLGCLLYELLVGEPPFDDNRLRDLTFVQVIAFLKDREPKVPSKRLAEAETPGGPAGQKQLPVDLDWIVMKAIDKEPERRYASVNALADDLRNFLSYRPVKAGPPSLTYRIRKLAKRHRPAVLAASCILLIAIMSGGFLLRKQVQARDLSATAEREKARAQAVLLRFQAIGDFARNLLESPNPFRGNAAGQAGEFLHRAAQNLEADLQDFPLIQAEIHATLGQTFMGLSLYDQSLEHLSRSLRLREKYLRPGHPDTLSTFAAMGLVLFKSGKYKQSAAVFQRGLRESDPLEPNSLLTCYRMRRGLAHAMRRGGDFQGALVHYRALLKDLRDTHGEHHRETLLTYRALGNGLRLTKSYKRAEDAYRLAYTGFRDRYGGEHHETLASLENMAIALNDQARYREAAVLFSRIAMGRARVLGPFHEDTLRSHAAHGDTLVRAGDHSRGISILSSAHEKLVTLLGEGHPRVRRVTNNLALAYQAQGGYARSADLLESLYTSQKAESGMDSPETLRSAINLADLYIRTGRPEEAEMLAWRVYEIRLASLTETHRKTLIALCILAEAILEQNRPGEALPLFTRLVHHAQKLFRDGHEHLSIYRGYLGRGLMALEDYPAAEQQLLGSVSRLMATDSQFGKGFVKDLVQLYKVRGNSEMADYWKRCAD